MLRRAATTLLLLLTLAGPAHAAGRTLMPGVTYERTVEFTPHGAAVLHVITAPRPGGLYSLGPVLAGGRIMGGLEPVTAIEKDVAAQSTAVGIDGDLFDAKDGHPAGIVMQNGALEHPPVSTRSSAGLDTAGTLHVDKVKFSATWQGTGQRRPLDGVDQAPAEGQTVLFTPAWGAPVPAVPGSAEIVFDQFPAALPNTVLQAAVTALGANGGETIPPLGAVLMATGAAAAKLQAEAPVGTTGAFRLVLQPSWTGVEEALGGGPVLVRKGKAVFHSQESFTSSQVTSRSPRAGIGQLADGRIVLVAVDGDQPGYSVGLSSYELAQAMVGLGAVTASAVDPGPSVTVAFDGALLNRPSAVGGERAVKEALLVQYAGVYAPEAPLPLVNGDVGRTEEDLSYKVVRPSTVTATLVGPDGVSHPIEAAVKHDPGTYAFTYSAFDAEGTWHWNVSATDDLGRVSAIDRVFRYDTTLRSLVVPKAARGSADVQFTLSRPAVVKMQIETTSGVVVRALAPLSLQAGGQAVLWDGSLATGTRAYAGTYVAHVFATSAAGTSDLSATFPYRRS